jgi:hypothetical protein
MRKLLAAICVASAALPALATDVGVSIQVSEPGLYGRIDIGRFPQPQVVVAQPVIVQRPAVVVARPEPVYMWVPPGHRKNWSKHCASYNACGVPVYFVKDDWYEHNVMKGSGRRDNDHGHPGKGHGKGKRKD